MPNARHTLEIVDCESPVFCAIRRVDQCVPPSGGVVSNVLTITSSTRSSDTVRGLPGLGERRHLRTVGVETSKRRATCALFSPAAHANTIRLRNANACAVFRRLAQLSSCERSPSLNVIPTGFGPRELIHEDYHKHQTN